MEFLSVIVAVGQNRLPFYRVPTPVLLPDKSKNRFTNLEMGQTAKTPRTTNFVNKLWNDYIVMAKWRVEKEKKRRGEEVEPSADDTRKDLSTVDQTSDVMVFLLQNNTRNGKETGDVAVF